MSRLFISHSSRDTEVTRRVQRWLAEQGHESLFLDFDLEAGIPAGQEWERVLYRKLRASQVVVLICTQNSLSSQWCFAEVAIARMERKPVIPILATPLDDANPLPDILKTIQRIDTRTGFDGAFQMLAQALNGLGIEPTSVRYWKPADAPYPGLSAFSEQDAAVFFGREVDISKGMDMLGSVRREGLVIVLGASGAGKSSLIHAGIVPRLRQQRGNWIVVGPFRPSLEPTDELATAIGKAFGLGYEQIRQDLGGGKDLASIIRGYRRRSQYTDGTVVLIIDQIEELLQKGSDQATDFLRLIRTAAEADDPNLVVLGTMRSDFLQDFQQNPMLVGLSFDSLHLSPLSLNQMRMVIEEPSRLAQLEFEPGLVDLLLSEVASTDALPLLAFMLRLLWNRGHERGELLKRDYEELGGLQGAVAQVAERAAKRPLRVWGEQVLGRMFLRLVRITDDGRWVRQRVRWSELPDNAREVLEEFVDSHLLVSAGDGSLGVCHEALFTAWPSLAKWMQGYGEELRVLGQVRSAAAEWERQGRRQEFLWPDMRLMTVWTMIEKLRPELNDTEKRFVRPFDLKMLAEEINERITSHERRAYIGDYLARTGDSRPGVGLLEDGLPDILWIDVPEGEITLDGGWGTFPVGPCRISKYTVTWAQYRSFVESDDGYRNPEWWDQLTRSEQPGEQYRREDNHPAENASWFDAVAYCRWLTARLGYEVRLPTEWEWQQAATHGNDDKEFPWGRWTFTVKELSYAYANTAENGLNRTIAVGMYGEEASAFGVCDLSGNVWEWCLNEFENPRRIEIGGENLRVVRGGSFLYKREFARTRYRDRDLPDWRNLGHGFRLLRAPALRK